VLSNSTLYLLTYFTLLTSALLCQLKEAGLWDSAASVKSSSSFTGTTCTSVSPSKRIHSTSTSHWSSRVHGRHVHQASYQQLMDIINLPRRSSVSHPSVELKSANCGHETDSASARVASPSAVGKSTPRSGIKDGSQQDEALKPTDVLVQLVDTL